MRTLKFEVELDIVFDEGDPNVMSEEQIMEIAKNIDEALRVYESQYGITPWPMNLKLIRVNKI